MGDNISQYLTYQHNVQRYFREHAEKYAGVIIPISIAVSFPTGTYGFVRALCAKHQHNYAIDPRTPLFQRRWNRDNLREPHKKMAAVLGDIFVKKGLTGYLDASGFADEVVINEVAKKCIEFQTRFRTREEDTKKLKKYKKLLGVANLEELGEPQFLIPPYFLFNQRGDEWYKINVKCIQRSVAMDTRINMQPVIHFRDWEKVGDWDGVFNDMKTSQIEAIWFYPDEYKEHEASLGSLKKYRASVEGAVKRNLRTCVLFGGYYSILMSYFGLEGFGNGIGYGEWRSSKYHRGGIAMKRVYVPKLHRYLDAPTAQHIIEKDSEHFASESEFLYECATTTKNLQDDEVTLAQCLDHFMESRQAETQFVANNGIEEAIEELQETCEHLKEIGPAEREEYGNSLERWREALETSE